MKENDLRRTGGLPRADLSTKPKPIADLKPYARNARTHSKKQVRQIAESVKEFGFTNPVLIDAGDRIIAGHGRVEAAKLLGMATVPTIRLEHLTDAQIRAYIIADNRLAELASWDRDILAIELQALTEIDLDFDIEVIGFETAEVDLLIDGLDDGEPDEADDVPEMDNDRRPATRPGDLWLLGPHRLLCADATSAVSYDQLLAGERAQMVFTDPPYNVPIDGHVSGLGRVRHDEFAMAVGEMSEDEFTQFLGTVFGHLVDHSVDGSIHYVCMDWRHVYELMGAARSTYAELKNLCVWNKDNGGMGSLYRSKHELIFVFKNGTAPHVNNVQLGRHGRNRTNVWDYPGVNTLRTGRMDELAVHPTVKPVAMVADAIRDCSTRDGIVLDAFAGSGTAIVAAEKTGRRGYGLELDPRYVDVAIDRWQRLTGADAVHEPTGLNLTELKTWREIEGGEDVVTTEHEKETADV